MKLKLTVITFALLASGLANAECPASMDKEEFIKCQGIEKTGANYQEWIKKQKAMVSTPTTSPITGEDVTTVAPSAGTATETAE